MTVARVREYNGVQRLTFHPPGYEFPLELPVITSGSRKDTNYWSWNGSLESPTIKPSVKTHHWTGVISHFWLNDGVCKFLSDSNDGNAGKTLPLLELKDEDC